MQNVLNDKVNVDEVLSLAYSYFKKTWLYHLLFSVIYMSLFMIFIALFAMKFDISTYGNELIEAYKNGMEAYVAKFQKISKEPNFLYFSYALIGISIFLFPLNLGLQNIFRKIDQNEPISIFDLFDGYTGSNVFRFFLYFLFWFVVDALLKQTIILPVFWVMTTLLVTPLMYFQNFGFIQAIIQNFKWMKAHFLVFFIVVLIGVFCKYFGFFAFIIGGLFTFPVWNSLAYSLYKSILAKEELKNQQQTNE